MTRITKWVLFAVSISIFFNAGLQAQTINAASCNASAVQAALSAVTSSTTTVNIPAGTCTWTSQVAFTVPAGVASLSIVGAGSLTTTGGGDQTVIVDNIGADTSPVSITTNSTGFFRLAGITFNAGTGTGKDDGFVVVYGPSSNVRIDHCHFNNTTGTDEVTRAVSVLDTYGVADHNIFDLGTSSSPGEINGIVVANPGTGTFGDESWAAATGLGSANFFFAEDNTVNYGAANDCQHGGRFIWRYNAFNTTSTQTHPTGGAGRGRGCRAWEVYQNTYSGAAGSQYNAFWVSSGTGVIWGNNAGTGSAYQQFLTLHSMRKNSATYSETATPNGWGYCGTSSGLAGDGSTWDQTQGSGGYACLDQPGRGKGDLLGGQFPNACDMSTGCSTYNGTWSNEALEPIYTWLNTGTYQNAVFMGGLDSGTALAETNNHDYYLWCNSSASTGCTTFTGASGVGSGLLSARPSTCSVQVGYWATDTNTLYVCATTNTWSTYYAPYTYPHPLTQGSGGTTGSNPSPPTVLQATAR